MTPAATRRPAPTRPVKIGSTAADPEGGGRERGSVTPFIVVMITGLLLVIGLVSDGGAALNAKLRATDVAQEAARSGAQALNLATYRATGQVVLDPAQADAHATAYLAAAGVTGAVTVAGNQVTVTVHTTLATPLLSLGGLREITVTGSGTARAVRGINTQDPGAGVGP
jgi:Flp pilus assembly protein TadG